jgi:hypothetical protein
MRVKFIASSKDYYDTYTRPVPAKNNIPKWYQNTPSYINNIKTIDAFGDTFSP